MVIDEITARRTGPRRISNTQNTFHIAVTGTISQYHTVDIVTNHHHSDCGIDENVGLTGNST